MRYLLILTALLYTGCGGGGASSTPSSTQSSPSTIEMAIDKSYSVSKGDQINKTSRDTKLNITKSIEDGSIEVILIEGSAKLTRAD